MTNESSLMTQMLRDSSDLVRPTYKSPKTHIITQLTDLAVMLKTMTDVADELRTLRSDLFWTEAKHLPDGRQQVRFQTIPTGYRLLDCLNLDMDQIRREYPQHEFNPLIRVFMAVAETYTALRRDRHLEQSGWYRQQRKHALEQHVAQLNALASKMKHALKSPGVAYLLRNFKRNADKRYKVLKRYWRSWLAACKRLCVIRVDLHYHGADWDGLTTISSEQAAADLEQFRAILCQRKKGTVFEHLVGFAWKRENGLITGHHTHLLCLFDGNKVQYDERVAELVGMEWVKFLDGHGWYYNCNRDKAHFQSCGIGNIKLGDAEQERGLDLACAYLTKVDYYVRMLGDGKRRAFGKGGLPDAYQHVNGANNSRYGKRSSRKPVKRGKVTPLFGSMKRGQ